MRRSARKKCKPPKMDYLDMQELVAGDSSTDYSDDQYDDDDEDEHEDGEDEKVLADLMSRNKISQENDHVLNNDDALKSDDTPPFYDADLDQGDERWVKENMRTKQGGKSAAMLSCAACFTMVCIDSKQVGECVFTAEKLFNYTIKNEFICCGECGAEIGKVKADATYILSEVLPSCI